MDSARSMMTQPFAFVTSVSFHLRISRSGGAPRTQAARKRRSLGVSVMSSTIQVLYMYLTLQLVGHVSSLQAASFASFLQPLLDSCEHARQHGAPSRW